MSVDTDIKQTDWTGVAESIAGALAPWVPEHDRSGAIDSHAFERLRAEGVTAALVPREFGGGGASHAEMGAILRTIARQDPSTAVALAMHSHLLAAQVWRHHHGIDASAVFGKVVGGAILVSTGASDWVGSNGVAVRTDEGFVVSARKSPASGCEVGQVLVTSILWPDAPDGPQVIHCAVPMAAPGVSIEHTWDTLGLRATGSHTVVLEDVEVPDAAVSLIRPAGEWHPVWNTVVGAAMPLIMAAYLGIADAAVEIVTSTLAGRDEPHVFQLVGEMQNAHVTASDLVAAMFIDTGDLHFDNTDQMAGRMLSRKTVAADAMIDAVRLAIEAIGGSGFSRGNDLERLYRDVHGSLFHPLPRAKQTRFSGRIALGLTPIG